MRLRRSVEWDLTYNCEKHENKDLIWKECWKEDNYDIRDRKRKGRETSK